MSFLFGVKKKEAPAPSAKDSIRTLREACEALEKRQAHLEKEASACHAKAKERMAAKDKRGTMFQLQMQKMKLKEVESSQGKMLNLMTMINQIETAVMSSGIAQAMQVGAQALTQLAQEANVEKIEQIMDSVQEATDDLNEVQEAMARPIAHFDEVLVVFTVSHRRGISCISSCIVSCFSFPDPTPVRRPVRVGRRVCRARTRGRGRETAIASRAGRVARRLAAAAKASGRRGSREQPQCDGRGTLGTRRPRSRGTKAGRAVQGGGRARRARRRVCLTETARI